MNANPQQYHPPPNQAGVFLPPIPSNPPIYSDLLHAQEYEDRLKWSLGNPNGIAATTDEVGQAMSYKAGLSFAVEPPAGAPAGAPDWVQALYVYLDNRFNATQNNIAQLCDEQLVLLANSQAGNGLPLYDPTLPGQWALLAAPNPTTRDDLMAFDNIQCMISAAALGLPPLPVDADLPTRKRQIAARIGVAMC